MDTPRSESSVSLRLSEIQQRIMELMDDEVSELRLEDGDSAPSNDDPYNRCR